jgi:lipopolysaccharide export system permease protein
MRAAGVSAWRFIMPAATAAFVMGLLTITLLNPLTTAMTAQFEVSRDAMMENYLKTAPKGTWLRQGDDKTQIVIRARARDQVDGAVRLRGVSLFVYTLNTKGVMDFSRRIEANEARLEPGFWRLIGVREATPGAGAIRSDSLSIPSNLDDRTASERFNNPQAVALWRLPGTIKRTEEAGFSATPSACVSSRFWPRRCCSRPCRCWRPPFRCV